MKTAPIITHPLPPVLAKILRPKREELADMVQKLRDAAVNTPVLDSSKEWTELIKEADALLHRRRYGGYLQKTNVNYERIRALAPVFYQRVESGDDLAVIARENGVNRSTVRNWWKREKKRREEARQS